MLSFDGTRNLRLIFLLLVHYHCGACIIIFQKHRERLFSALLCLICILMLNNRSLGLHLAMGLRSLDRRRGYRNKHPTITTILLQLLFLNTFTFCRTIVLNRLILTTWRLQRAVIFGILFTGLISQNLFVIFLIDLFYHRCVVLVWAWAIRFWKHLVFGVNL